MTIKELAKQIKDGRADPHDYGLDERGVIEVGLVEADGLRKIKGGVMRMTFVEFHTRLTDARATDYRLPNLKVEAWLWSRFAFGNDGVHYVERISEPPVQPDVALFWSRHATYLEPEVFILQ